MIQTVFRNYLTHFGGILQEVMIKKGTFGVIVTYSEDGKDVDELMKMYEEWANKTSLKQNSLFTILSKK